MRRCFWIALTVALVACGGSSKPPAAKMTGTTETVRKPDTRTTVLASRTELVDRDPIDAEADTLLYEYIQTRGKKASFDVPALSGEVRCYGGPAIEGNVPVEIYVRRAVNRAAVVEDVVTIYPDDLVAHRRMLTMKRGPGVSDLVGRAGELRGRALVEDSAGAMSVQALEDAAGAIQFVAQKAEAKSLRIIAYAVDPADAAGVGIVVDALATPEAWANAQTDVLDLASNSALMTIKGDLPSIENKRCGRIFGHFPPP
jgi:hypothetical protein